MPKTDQGDPELRRLGKRLARIEASLAGLEAMLRAHLTPGQAGVGASAARRSDETKAAWNAAKRQLPSRAKMAKGQELYLPLVAELAGLAPDGAFLDVGCGSGTMTHELFRYLSAHGGRYEGFDVKADLVTQLTQQVTAHLPSFRFTHLDIRNGYYNPNGVIDAAAVRFPYQDATFDVVFLRSVVTHMLLPEVEHYFDEIARVLKPGGRSFVTWFVLNAASQQYIDLTRLESGVVMFPHERGGYRVHDAAQPERIVGYYEDQVRRLHTDHGLTVVEPIRPGKWMGNEQGLGWQDIVIGHKAAAAISMVAAEPT